MKQIPKFEGTIVGGSVKPRTVADLKNNSSVIVGYLHGEIGEEAGAKYDNVIDDKYEGNENLKVLKFDKRENILKGSNVCAVSILNEHVFPEYKLESVDLSVLDKAMVEGFELEGYIDLGLMLNGNKVNSYQARKVADQLSDELELPAVINAKDVKIINDAEAPEGVSFKVNGEKAFNAPALIESGKYSKKDERGIPIPDENGDKNFYVGKDGLFRLGLYRDGDFDFPWNGLQYSYLDGRVVAVKKSE